MSGRDLGAKTIAEKNGIEPVRVFAAEHNKAPALCRVQHEERVRLTGR
jgi:hypothetical protein